MIGAKKLQGGKKPPRGGNIIFALRAKLLPPPDQNPVYAPASLVYFLDNPIRDQLHIYRTYIDDWLPHSPEKGTPPTYSGSSVYYIISESIDR